jgi:hypothetical protein
MSKIPVTTRSIRVDDPYGSSLFQIIKKDLIQTQSTTESQGEGTTNPSNYLIKLLKNKKLMETLYNIYPDIQTNETSRKKFISAMYKEIERYQENKQSVTSMIENKKRELSQTTYTELDKLNDLVIKASSIYDANLKDIKQSIIYIYDEVSQDKITPKYADDLVQVITTYGPTDFVNYWDNKESVITSLLGPTAEDQGQAYVNLLISLNFNEATFKPLSCYTSSDDNNVELNPILKKILDTSDFDLKDSKIAFIYVGMHATIALHVRDTDGTMKVFSITGLYTGSLPTSWIPKVTAMPFVAMGINNALSDVWIASIDQSYQPFTRSRSDPSKYVRTFAPVIKDLTKENIQAILNLSQLVEAGGHRVGLVHWDDEYNIGFKTNQVYSLAGCPTIGTNNCASIAMLIGASQGIISEGYKMKIWLPIDNPQTMRDALGNTAFANEAYDSIRGKEEGSSDELSGLQYTSDTGAPGFLGATSSAMSDGGSKRTHKHSANKTRKHKKSKKTRKYRRIKKKRVKKSKKQ